MIINLHTAHTELDFTLRNLEVKVEGKRFRNGVREMYAPSADAGSDVCVGGGVEDGA